MEEELLELRWVMIERYETKGMRRIWEESNRFKFWALSLLAVLWLMVKRGKLADGEFLMVKENILINPQRVVELDLGTEDKPGFNHDAQAAIEAAKESLREAGVPEKVIAQLGAHITSYGMEDPAFSRLIIDSCELVLTALDVAIATLKKRAAEHRYTICSFITHGQLATPGYLGIRICRWIAMLERDKKRIEFAMGEMAVASLGGATGIYDELSPEEEAEGCKFLELEVADGPSQIIHRDIHTTVMAMLAICARDISQIANDFWLMCQSSRLEAREYTNPKQRGSTAMPHKKNPITAERLRGMSSLIIGYLTTALEQMMTYDERAIDQSSVERVIWPDAFHLVHFMLGSLDKMISKALFFPDKMKVNLEATLGIWASQYVKNALWDKGVHELKFQKMYPIDAYDEEFKYSDKNKPQMQPTYVWVQSCAFEAWDLQTNTPLKPLNEVLISHGVLEFLNAGELNQCFDIKYILRHADVIYERRGISRVA